MKVKKISLKEHERIRNCLYEELKRKDSIIDDLKKKNELLLKSALIQAKKYSDDKAFVDNVKEKD